MNIPACQWLKICIFPGIFVLLFLYLALFRFQPLKTARKAAPQQSLAAIYTDRFSCKFSSASPAGPVDIALHAFIAYIHFPESA